MNGETYEFGDGLPQRRTHAYGLCPISRHHQKHLLMGDAALQDPKKYTIHEEMQQTAMSSNTNN